MGYRIFCTVVFILLSHSSCFTQLSGVYSVGGVSPDYPDLRSAGTDLMTNGVSGPVIFDIRSGTYYERLVLGPIPTTSSTNTVLFRSTTGLSQDVLISYDSDIDTNYTLFLDGADFVSFENVTIQSTDPQYGRVVLMENNAHHNSFRSCVFRGINTVSNSNGLALLRSNGENSHLTLEGCEFEYGSKGISIISVNHGAINTLIRDNAFRDQYLKAIELERADAVTIEKNHFETATNSNLFECIHLAECDSGVTVQQNSMELPAPAKAINIWRCFASANDRAVVANNTVYIEGGIGSSAVGVSLFWSEYYDFIYNSIHIAESNSNSSIFSINSVISEKIRLYNNSFSNLGDGYVLNIGWLPNVEISDYNNLYTEGDNIAIIDTHHIPDLITWQDTTTMDSNAISVDPLFIFAPDLHLPDTALEGKALPLSAYTEDLDGDTRDPQAPDIGADEFTWVPPISAFSATPTDGCSPLTVNFSDQSQNYVSSYAWDVDGDGNDDYFTDSLSHTYTTPGLYSVRLITSNTGGSDTLIWLDSIDVQLCQNIEESFSSINVYPSPTDNLLNISLNEPHFHEFKIKVIDLAGRQVFQQLYPSHPATERIKIPTDHLSQGIYILAMESETSIEFVKFSVKR